ncbi:MAG: hypothetical protein R6U40_02185, partial [Desulfobacterales bacterium]
KTDWMHRAMEELGVEMSDEKFDNLRLFVFICLPRMPCSSGRCYWGSSGRWYWGGTKGPGSIRYAGVQGLFPKSMIKVTPFSGPTPNKKGKSRKPQEVVL